MKRVAIIPARGGSKRIPGKNIKNFLGKPIIQYSIEAAINSGLFDEVMVSTDDQKIADVAVKCGAVVPFLRSAENADDYAPMVAVVKEVLERYLSEGRDFEEVCCILPTAPFVTETRLQQGQAMLKDFDSVMTVVEYSYPIQRALKIEEGLVSFINPDMAKMRSQDLMSAFHDCGQFYWTKAENVRSASQISNGKVGALILPESEVQDIDVAEDWKVAEMKFSLMSKNA